MTDEPIRDETLINLLRERGYIVSKQEEVNDRLESLEAELRELKERPPRDRDPEATFAERLAQRLDESRSKWYTPGGEGGPDAA